MESVKMAEICGARKGKKYAKLTMEGYLDFLHAEKRPDLTVDHLNQIISMHGFRKFAHNHRASKSVMVEVVGKMELVDPTRSTVDGEGVTSDATLGLEDVVKDLNELNWQECCVTSIQPLKAAVGHHEGVILGGRSEGTVLSAAAATSSKKPPPAGKRGRRIGKVANGSPEKLALKNFSPRKKKRTVRSVNSVRSGVGMASSSVATGADV